MEPSQRIVINTAVQYIRSVIYLVLTLFSTRYILLALGQSDFGLYAVIGSVVTLLGFITTSLASSTQRFLSVTHGKQNNQELAAIFSNAMFIHVSMAMLLLVLMVLLSSPILHYLHIPDGRFEAGQFVYYMVIAMVVLSFVTSPIRALYIARENIIFVSIVEIADATLRFAGAIILLHAECDRLILYAAIMATLSLINLVVYLSYASKHYPECHLPRRKEIKWIYLTKLADFAVWNIYGVGATIVRTQGIAIIINRFFGTIINAAYGIALQMSNATSFLATSILSAMNPQLMKAEGANDRDRMINLATRESRYSFMVMSLVLIPIIIEMPQILHAWLGQTPEYAVMFCRFILLAFIIDQITIGLTSANQAIGNIRNYNLVIGTLRLAIIPAAYFAIAWSKEPAWAMYVYLGIEMICGLCRLPFLKATAGLNIAHYCYEVVIRNILPIIGNVALGLISVFCIHSSYRWIITTLICFVSGCIMLWIAALTKEEKQWIKLQINHKLTEPCN